MTNVGDLLKIARTGGFSDQKRAQEEAKAVPIERAPAIDKSQALSVTWIGHASTVIRIGGRTFLTDPVWSDKIPGNVRRLTPPGLAWDALPKIDGVLISHDHYDHLDTPTIKRLPRDTPIHCGLNLGRWFHRRGFVNVHEHEWGDTVEADGIERTFVRVEHWCQRLPFMRDTNLWGGWVLRKKGTTTGGVFFAGDTAYERHFKDIGAIFPALDVAVLPIGAYEPQWFMQHAHVSPEEAVQAFIDTGATVMVPMHWGTFALSREPVDEPPRRLQTAWLAAGLSADRLAVLPVGGTWTSTKALQRPALPRVE